MGFNEKTIVKWTNIDKIKQSRTLSMNDKNHQSGVDQGLIAMYLKMSVEERLLTNDDAVRTIQELRDAFREKKKRGPQLTS
jgi:hypothetical protein